MGRPHNGQSVCHTCGANTIEHRHSLTPGLASGLFAFANKGGGPINLKEVGLTRNQWDNFQKLKYWSLVAQGDKNGVWSMLPDGWSFLEGTLSKNKHVWTYRGFVLEFEGPQVFIKDVWKDMPYYLNRADYAAASGPLSDSWS